MTEVSVATWNLHQGVDKHADHMAATWRYLEDKIQPIVALVQEAHGEIPPTPGGSISEEADDLGRWSYRTAVVAYEGRLEPMRETRSKYAKGRAYPLRLAVPASHAVARVELADQEPLVVASLYGRILEGYSQTSILRVIADLIPLFDTPLHRRRMVVGGDLNAFNTGPRVDDVSRERWAAILELFRSLGLVNLLEKTQAERGPLPGCRCGMGNDCYHVETWRAIHGVPGVWCLDYLFATADLAARLKRPLEIWGVDRPEVWNLSDHCPLVARFDL